MFLPVVHRHSQPVPLVALRHRRGRCRPAAQAPLPQRPVLPRPRGAVPGHVELISWLLNRWSLAGRPRRPTPACARKMAIISGPGLVFWGFSVTFMSVDWVLSINPHWFSTMFGLLFMAGQGLSSLAFLITVMVLLSYRSPLQRRPHAAPPARSRQAAARHGDGLGLFRLLPVPDHLGRQPARRNHLVHGAPQRRLAICRAGPGLRPLRAALRAAALARSQAQFQAAGVHRRFHSVHALRRRLLAGGARISATPRST